MGFVGQYCPSLLGVWAQPCWVDLSDCFGEPRTLWAFIHTVPDGRAILLMRDQLKESVLKSILFLMTHLWMMKMIHHQSSSDEA